MQVGDVRSSRLWAVPGLLSGRPVRRPLDVEVTSNDRWTTCAAYLEAECNPTPGWWPDATQLYAHILWTLTESIAATSILEIGVGPTSVSGCTFAHSMGSRGGGRLWSVDVDPARPADIYRDLARRQSVTWTVVHGDSLDVAAELPAGLQVDLLYIDGDHDCAHAYGDTVAYLRYLRPGGLLVIDDYPSFEGVSEAKQLLEADGFTFVHLPHEPPAGNGRLVWQKPRVS
jgi:predicted O-methyltransferase YrrM